MPLLLLFNELWMFNCSFYKNMTVLQGTWITLLHAMHSEISNKRSENRIDAGIWPYRCWVGSSDGWRQRCGENIYIFIFWMQMQKLKQIWGKDYIPFHFKLKLYYLEIEEPPVTKKSYRFFASRQNTSQSRPELYSCKPSIISQLDWREKR